MPSPAGAGDNPADMRDVLHRDGQLVMPGSLGPPDGIRRNRAGGGAAAVIRTTTGTTPPGNPAGWGP